MFDSALRLSGALVGEVAELRAEPGGLAARLRRVVCLTVSVAVFSGAMGLFVYLVGFAVGKRVTTPVTVLAAVGLIAVFAIVFASLGLLLAGVLRRPADLFAVGTAAVLFAPFVSGAYLSLHMLPGWLQGVALANPLTYAVATFRAASRESWSLPVEQMLGQELTLQVGDSLVRPAGSLALLAGLGVVLFVAVALVLGRQSRRPSA